MRDLPTQTNNYRVTVHTDPGYAAAPSAEELERILDAALGDRVIEVKVS